MLGMRLNDSKRFGKGRRPPKWTSTWDACCSESRGALPVEIRTNPIAVDGRG